MSSKRFDRHDLKRPDAFVDFVMRQFNWARRHLQTVGGVLGLILILLVAGFAFAQYRQSAAREAFYHYGKADAELREAMHKSGPERQQAIEEAVTKLQTLYDANRSTRAAAFTLFSIGQAYFELRRYEQAANAFETAAKEFDDDPNFKAMALAGAAKSWEALRQVDKALDAYSRANAIEGNPYAEMIKSDMGRLKVYQESARPARAVTTPTQIQLIP